MRTPGRRTGRPSLVKKRDARPTAARRGYGYRWQQYRLEFLGEHPLCVHCEAEDRITPATVVDHVVPHRGDEGLFWDEENHQALCKQHHDRKTASGG